MITDIMSHSQFHRIKWFILGHAWLNLWDKHMTTGRINQVTYVLMILCRCGCGFVDLWVVPCLRWCVMVVEEERRVERRERVELRAAREDARFVPVLRRLCRWCDECPGKLHTQTHCPVVPESTSDSADRLPTNTQTRQHTRPDPPVLSQNARPVVVENSATSHCPSRPTIAPPCPAASACLSACPSACCQPVPPAPVRHL